MALVFRSFALLSVLISAALAQSTDPFIPADISSSCSTYLSGLNSNSNLAPCMTPFLNAFSQFCPGTNATSISPSTIRSLLAQICTGNAFSSCPQSTITTELTKFYGQCSKELTSSPDETVKMNYDTLYVLTPMRQAMCAVDDNGNYCLANLSNSSSSGDVDLVDPSKPKQDALLISSLYISPSNSAPARRDLSNGTVAYAPNATTFQSTNLPFMFLQPDMSEAALCTTCTKNIMTPFISFESTCPYASGMSSSPLLSGQIPLYNSITQKCGSSFLGGAVQAAGGLSSGLLSSAAPRVTGQELSAAVSAILGVAAFVVAAL